MGELGKYCLNTCTNEWFSYVSYTPERGCTITVDPGGEGCTLCKQILLIAHSVSGPLLGEAHAPGLTFVERCLSGLVGDVGLGASLEQELEAVHVSPAGRQVKGRFLLQRALVDDCRVCCGGQTRKFVKEEDTHLSLQHRVGPDFLLF